MLDGRQASVEPREVHAVEARDREIPGYVEAAGRCRAQGSGRQQVVLGKKRRRGPVDVEKTGRRGFSGFEVAPTRLDSQGVGEHLGRGSEATPDRPVRDRLQIERDRHNLARGRGRTETGRAHHHADPGMPERPDVPRQLRRPAVVVDADEHDVVGVRSFDADHGDPSRPEARQQIVELLAAREKDHSIDRHRVEEARRARPRADPSGHEQIQQRLAITTVMVTHDQEEALAISDRVAVMNGGRVEQVDAPSAVYAAPATSFVASFIGSMNVLTSAELDRVRHGRAEAAGASETGGPFAVGEPLEAGEPFNAEGETWAVRPEHVVFRPVPGGPIEVRRILPHGHFTEVVLDAGGLELRSVVTGEAPREGDRGDVTLTRVQHYRDGLLTASGESR